ncbi:MAG: hemin uptake protein HemP [Gammaproteobacteria bacterium]|nr:hemin uptake protein HemP [Gammaproteobacteria bacterium]
MQDIFDTKPDTPLAVGGIDGLPLLNTADLFGNSSEIKINHRDEIYRLRITRQGKLILTK